MVLLPAWVLGVVVLAGPLGSSARTEALVVPWLEGQGVDPLWAHRAHKALRKAGHVLAYAAFAAGLWWALPAARRRAWWAVGAAGALAALDEGLQALHPERGASARDVLLDLLAACLAVAWLERRARRRATAGGASARG